VPFCFSLLLFPMNFRPILRQNPAQMSVGDFFGAALMSVVQLLYRQN
jgi:hypothetical protein